MLARVDPGDAERLARATDKAVVWRAEALAKVAGVLVGADPGRARTLFAESVALILGHPEQERVLASIAGALARLDADEAERLARAIPGQPHRSKALKKVAEELARTDPHDAERIAHTIAPGHSRTRTLVGIAIARALAVHRPVDVPSDGSPPSADP